MMNNLLSGLPMDWLTQCVAAQGRALMYLTNKQTEKLDDDEELSHRSIIYFGWILNRTGVFTLEDQIQVVSQVLVQADFLERVRAALSVAYEALDAVYEMEKESKKLVSDVFGKSVLQ